jgi:hypothetical protein
MYIIIRKHDAECFWHSSSNSWTWDRNKATIFNSWNGAYAELEFRYLDGRILKLK